MDRHTMPSIADWLLLASVHREPVPSQVTAAGSCAQVTRPGITPRATPNGERGSKREGLRVAAVAIDKANCLRVISISLFPFARNLTPLGNDATQPCFGRHSSRNQSPMLARLPDSNIHHCSGQVIGPNHLIRE